MSFEINFTWRNLIPLVDDLVSDGHLIPEPDATLPPIAVTRIRLYNIQWAWLTDQLPHSAPPPPHPTFRSKSLLKGPIFLLIFFIPSFVSVYIKTSFLFAYLYQMIPDVSSRGGVAYILHVWRPESGHLAGRLPASR